MAMLLNRSSRLRHSSLSRLIHTGFAASSSPSLLSAIDRDQKADLPAFCSSSSASSSHTKELGFAAISAAVGAVAFFSAWHVGTSSSPAEMEADKIALNPNEWKHFKLQQSEKISHNTKLHRFELDPDSKLGLNVASCILTRAQMGTDKDGKPKFVIRPYTPISNKNAKGYFDLLIKEYPEGKLSKHIANLKPGDTLEVKGPIPKLTYTPNMKKNIGMIAGGTGVTPMLQIIEEILNNPEDNTQIAFLYGNLSPEEILLKERIDALAESHPNLKVFYIVDKPTDGWRGGSGYITKDLIVKGMPAPADDILILVCGPPGMMKHISGDKAPDRSQGELSGLLKEAGYKADQVYKF
ncbi:hypothetical protein O6H91_16G078500 [Diphasiastrum complanatum]|uniref:Uncharacterized protein n=1 Tax=Diphasiastrum complanatum TaxID=34168 RepID=A0ACC2BE78_DIPCM|nr:hypothetical protein O6H91_16G078500 [Diphasiastrum complanatum]